MNHNRIDARGHAGNSFSISNARDIDKYELPPRNRKSSRRLHVPGAGAAHPRQWSKRTRIIAIGIAIGLLIIMIVVAAVEGVRKTRYPDYKPLRYTLRSSFDPQYFYQNFQYWSDPDPAHGFVQYTNSSYATSLNLTSASFQSALLRVDDTLTDQRSGRPSVRVASTETYNSGLFLFDIKHSPIGCGAWPAVWLCDSYNCELHFFLRPRITLIPFLLPQNGEIDVIEAINNGNRGSSATLHTSKGCKMKIKRKQTGKSLKTDCYNATSANAGCGVQSPPSTFGEEFNNNGGGVFATEWRKAGIRVWFFPRANIPDDVSTSIALDSAGTTPPSPSTWGEALADFPSTECDVSSHFRNASIVTNISMCGSWAGGKDAYTVQGKCSGKCDDYVADTPEAFGEAYWEFGAFKVYQADGEER